MECSDDDDELFLVYQQHLLLQKALDHSDAGFSFFVRFEDHYDHISDYAKTKKRKANGDRSRLLYADSFLKGLLDTYLSYSSNQFRTRFRMPIELFNSIHEQIVEFDQYFLQKTDARALLGFTSKNMLCFTNAYKRGFSRRTRRQVHNGCIKYSWSSEKILQSINWHFWSRSSSKLAWKTLNESSSKI